MDSEDFDRVLGLPGLTITETKTDCEQITLYYKAKDRCVCPICGSFNVSKNGKYIHELNDVPLYGMQTTAIIEDNKYKCMNQLCPDKGKQFLREFPGAFEKNAQMTKRLKQMVFNTPCNDRTFLDIGRSFFLTAITVERIYREKFRFLSKHRVVESAPVIGIDEVHIANTMCLVLTDLSNKKEAKIIDIFPDKKAENIKQAYSLFLHPEKILFVNMDMYGPYRDMAYKMFPNCEVVIDRFHVMEHFMDYYEDARKNAVLYVEKIINEKDEPQRSIELNQWHEYRNKMNHYWFKKDFAELSKDAKNYMVDLCYEYPVFKKVLDCKVTFQSMYTAESREKGEKIYNDFKEYILSLGENHFLSPLANIIKLVDKHYTDIFNYYDVPEESIRSNGGTEGLNSEIKRVDYLGRGYSFESLRGKLLFGNVKYTIRDKVIVPHPETALEYFQSITPKQISDLPDDRTALSANKDFLFFSNLMYFGLIDGHISQNEYSEFMYDPKTYLFHIFIEGSQLQNTLQRLCIDAKHNNGIVEIVSYTPPSVDEFIAGLGSIMPQAKKESQACLVPYDGEWIMNTKYV